MFFTSQPSHDHLTDIDEPWGLIAAHDYRREVWPNAIAPLALRLDPHRMT